MKNSKIFALFAVLAALATSAIGNTVTLGANNGNYRVGSGGEFNWIPQAGDPDSLLASYSPLAVLGSGFESFCIQVDEHINFGGTYQYAISTSAKGPTGADEISQGTAWLYSQFATGTLSGYNYTPGAARAASAGDLQNAIWYLEGEILLSAVQVGGNQFLSGSNGAITHFGDLATTQQNALGLYGVYALNLGPVGAQSDWSNQDQLVYRVSRVPDASATLVLVSLSFIGLAFARRRI